MKKGCNASLKTVFWCWLNTPKKPRDPHGSSSGIYSPLQVFLEALKVTQQCKVASTWSCEVVLPLCLATQPQHRTLGNVPDQSFILCSPRRQGLQSVGLSSPPPLAPPQYQYWCLALAQAVKCLCRATLLTDSRSSSRLSQQHRPSTGPPAFN